MHEALKVVAKQGEQWHQFVPHGGWPGAAQQARRVISTQEALVSNMTALDTVLSTTPAGGNLETADFEKVEARLKALLDDRKALDTLPERCLLEQEFASAGLNELVADLNARRVSVEQVRGEVQLAWWTTVFEDIVRSSAIISNQDGAALQAASDRFAQVDVEHVRSIGPMVSQESMRRLCDMLFSRTQEANQMHTVLAGRASVSLSRIRRDHPEILAAAKPILVAAPGTLAALTEPGVLADVAILDACAHIPAIELLSIIGRVQQVVVIAHCATVTSESVKQLIDTLPHIEVDAAPSRRAPRLSAFLESEGYGPVRYDVATEPAAGECDSTVWKRAVCRLCLLVWWNPASRRLMSGASDYATCRRFCRGSFQLSTCGRDVDRRIPHTLGCRIEVVGRQIQGDGPIPAPCAVGFLA